MGTESDSHKHTLQDSPELTSEYIARLSGLEEEETMDISSIQGDILTGYLKDHQTLIFLHVLEGEEKNFHRWLGKIEPLLDSKKVSRRHGEFNSPQATWVNIAFSVDVIERLSRTAPQFRKHYFAHEKEVQSSQFDGPSEQRTEGKASDTISNSDNEADVVLIIASDSKSDMLETVARIDNTIRGLSDDSGQHVGSGTKVMFKQIGATLAAPLTGYEQFGFRDGTAQSASGAKLSNQLENFLSPRQDTNNHKQGKTVQSSATSRASKQSDQTTDSISIQQRRVTYSAISHEYTIDMKGIQENSKRQFVPTYLGLPGLVPSNYLRAWRYQVPHHAPKGGQPVLDALAAEGNRRNFPLRGQDHQST